MVLQGPSCGGDMGRLTVGGGDPSKGMGDKEGMGLGNGGYWKRRGDGVAEG